MAQKLFLCDLNLSGNSLKNVAVEVLAAAPESPVTGRVYFDSTDNAIKVWNGTAWKVVVNASDISQTVVENDAHAVSGGAVFTAIKGLSGAMHFIGVAHDTQLEGDMEVILPDEIGSRWITHNKAFANGDVLIYGIKEYIYASAQWNKIGDETLLVTSFGGKTGAITVRGSMTVTGKVNLSMSGNELQADLVMPVATDILMTGYAKAVSEAAVAVTDSVSEAIGKIEYKVDALKQEVIDNELVTSEFLNDHASRISTLETSVASKASQSDLTALAGRVTTAESDIDALQARAELKYYATSITSDAGSHTYTLTAATHGCGTTPVLTVYYDGAQVVVENSINASGDITISWAASVVVSAAHAIVMNVMGHA